MIDVIGVGADGPAGMRPELTDRIRRANFVAGGERHLRLMPVFAPDPFVIRDNIPELIAELRRHHTPDSGPGRCVVLASGDPLFYGIGTALIEAFGRDQVRVEPAVSSMQLAFARAGIPWHEAALASVHGRDVRQVLLPLLGQRTIGLFTRDGDSPDAIARFCLDRRGPTYRAFVGENLGAADETGRGFDDITQLVGVRFGPLNYLILHRPDAADAESVEWHRRMAPGVPDDAFDRPADGPAVMTRQEVRSVVVGKLLGPNLSGPGDVLWDLGAGLGTVSVECAVLRPWLDVVAVESNPMRTVYLWQNRARFGAYNITVVEGRAPAAVRDLQPDPSAVFLGGSGPHLPEILGLIGERLRPGGRFVAPFVTLEHFTQTFAWLRDRRWRSEVTELQVARGDDLAGLTGLRPHRGVFLLTADKPG